MKKKVTTQKGFTLLELLVAIAIVALLVSIVLSSTRAASRRARDSERVQITAQIQRGLELYYAASGTYPAVDRAQTNGSPDCGNGSWDSFRNLMQDFIPIDCDPLGAQTAYRFFYDSDTGDNNQTYGFMVRLEDEGNYNLVNDGGYRIYADTSSGEYLEVGQQPAYCNNTYTNDNAANWFNTGGSGCTADSENVCCGGN